MRSKAVLSFLRLFTRSCSLRSSDSSFLPPSFGVDSEGTKGNALSSGVNLSYSDSSSRGSIAGGGKGGSGRYSSSSSPNNWESWSAASAKESSWTTSAGTWDKGNGSGEAGEGSPSGSLPPPTSSFSGMSPTTSLPAFWPSSFPPCSFPSSFPSLPFPSSPDPSSSSIVTTASFSPSLSSPEAAPKDETAALSSPKSLPKSCGQKNLGWFRKDWACHTLVDQHAMDYWEVSWMHTYCGN